MIHVIHMNGRVFRANTQRANGAFRDFFEASCEDFPKSYEFAPSRSGALELLKDSMGRELAKQRPQQGA